MPSCALPVSPKASSAPATMATREPTVWPVRASTNSGDSWSSTVTSWPLGSSS